MALLPSSGYKEISPDSTCDVEQRLQSRGALSVHRVDGDRLWKPTERKTEQ